MSALSNYSDHPGLRLSQIVADVEAVQVMTPAPQLGKAALWYATRWDFPVFPLKARGKSPVTHRGFKDASTDPDVVQAMWQRAPDSNVGVPTGTVAQGGCGFDVIDVDGEQGHATFETLQDDLPPILAVAFTPGDPTKPGRTPGRHYYIAAQNQQSVNNLLPGIDVKANGAYVVAPPSIALHGVGYAWLGKPEGKV